MVHSNQKITIETASRVLAWYREPSSDPDVLASLLPPTSIRPIFNFRGAINFPAFLSRQLGSDEFSKIRRYLLGKWDHLQGPISAESAKLFLQDFVEQFDHALLFCEEITVGLTRAQRANPPSDYATSYHAQRMMWTLHMTVEGGVDYHAGQHITAGVNDLVLISPKASLHYRRSDQWSQWIHHWALFSPAANWLELMEWPMCAYGVYKLSVDDLALSRTLKTIFEQMVDLYESPPALMNRLLMNQLEHMLILIAGVQAEDCQPHTDPRVLKACKYMEENLATPLSVGDIAEHCRISDSRLSHLFKESLGQSVKAFHNSIRMQRAKRLLATTSEPVAHVGTAVGYEEPAQFSKFFSRNMNCSPRTFRQEFTKALDH